MKQQMVSQKLKSTKFIEINSRIEELSTNNDTEQEICNEDNLNTLGGNRFDNTLKGTLPKIMFMIKIKIKKIVQNIKK